MSFGRNKTGWGCHLVGMKLDVNFVGWRFFTGYVISQYFINHDKWHSRHLGITLGCLAGLPSGEVIIR